MTSDLRLGLVGCGRLAELGHIPAMRKASGLTLAAVADPELSRCRRLAPDVPAFDSAAALLAAGGVDALVLATPAAAHVRDATAAVDAGVPVLVEKPPAPGADEAAVLVRLDPSPWIGLNRRFEPGIRRLRERIGAGAARELDLALHQPGRWASHAVADDVLLATGTHLIDLARWLSGAGIERVRATELSEDVASLELELDGARARISCARGRPHRDRVEVRGRDGATLGRYVGEVIWRRGLRRLARLGTASGLVHLLVLELEEFAGAVRGKPAPTLATAADGVAMMAAVDAAHRSAISAGAWIDCPARVG